MYLDTIRYCDFWSIVSLLSDTTYTSFYFWFRIVVAHPSSKQIDAAMASRMFFDDIPLLSVGAFHSRQAEVLLLPQLGYCIRLSEDVGRSASFALPYGPPNDFVLGEWGRSAASFNGSTLAAHRSRRSNEQSLAHHSPDRGSIRSHHLFEHSGQRGRSRVVRSIDRSRRTS